jgi:uncharacterized protein YjbJ (UPF0337 family)
LLSDITTRFEFEDMTDLDGKGNWKKTKGRLKQKFAALTNNDTLLWEGKKDEVIGRLQIELGKTKEELMKIISEIY